MFQKKWYVAKAIIHQKRIKKLITDKEIDREIDRDREIQRDKMDEIDRLS